MSAPTIHCIRTNLPVHPDITGDVDRTVVPVDIWFSYARSLHRDSSAEIGFLSVQPVNSAATPYCEDVGAMLRGDAEAAYVTDDGFYERLVGAAESDRKAGAQ